MDIKAYVSILYDLQTLILEDPGGSLLPNSNEIEEYAGRVGIDSKSEPYLLQLAIEGFMMKLPLFWKPCWDGSQECIYYFNFKTGESTWEHPFDIYFRSALPKLREKQKTGFIVESIKPVFYDFVTLQDCDSAENFHEADQVRQNKSFPDYSYHDSINKKYLTLPSNYKHRAKHQRSKSLHDGIFIKMDNNKFISGDGKQHSLSATSERAQVVPNTCITDSNDKRSKSSSDINESSRKLLFMDQIIHEQCSQLTRLIKENHIYSTKYQMMKEKWCRLKSQLSRYKHIRRLSAGIDQDMSSLAQRDLQEDSYAAASESDSSGNAFHEDLPRSRSSTLNKTKKLLTEDQSLYISDERLLRDIHHKTDKACARLSQAFACLKALESDVGLLLSNSLASELSDNAKLLSDNSAARRGILVSMRGLDMGLNYLRSDLLEINYKVRDNLRFSSSYSDYNAEKSYEMSVSDKIEEQRQWLNAIKCQAGISSPHFQENKYDQSK